jgi:hypothetical protein
MDWLALAMLSPLAWFAAVLVLRRMRRRGVEPTGIGPATASGLLASLLLGAMLAVGAINSLAVTPLGLQQQLLGSVAAGPLELAGFRETFLPDSDPATRRIWSFRPRPAALAALRRRCGPPTLSGGCLLAFDDGERWDTRISLFGEEMRIDQSPGRG